MPDNQISQASKRIATRGQTALVETAPDCLNVGLGELGDLYHFCDVAQQTVGEVADLVLLVCQ